MSAVKFPHGIISSDYRWIVAQLDADSERYTDGYDRKLRSDIVQAGRMYAAGYVMLVAPATGGAKFVTDSGTVLERQSLYALAPSGSEVHVAYCMVKAIHARHGPGKLWTVGPVVDLAADDDRVPCGTIDGDTYVLLKSYYFHDPIPAPGEAA